MADAVSALLGHSACRLLRHPAGELDVLLALNALLCLVNAQHLLPASSDVVVPQLPVEQGVASRRTATVEREAVLRALAQLGCGGACVRDAASAAFRADVDTYTRAITLIFEPAVLSYLPDESDKRAHALAIADDSGDESWADEGPSLGMMRKGGGNAVHPVHFAPALVHLACRLLSCAPATCALSALCDGIGTLAHARTSPLLGRRALRAVSAIILRTIDGGLLFTRCLRELVSLEREARAALRAEQESALQLLISLPDRISNLLSHQLGETPMTRWPRAAARLLDVHARADGHFERLATSAVLVATEACADAATATGAAADAQAGLPSAQPRSIGTSALLAALVSRAARLGHSRSVLRPLLLHAATGSGTRAREPAVAADAAPPSPLASLLTCCEPHALAQLLAAALGSLCSLELCDALANALPALRARAVGLAAADDDGRAMADALDSAIVRPLLAPAIGLLALRWPEQLDAVVQAVLLAGSAPAAALKERRDACAAPAALGLRSEGMSEFGGGAAGGGVDSVGISALLRALARVSTSDDAESGYAHDALFCCLRDSLLPSWGSHAHVLRAPAAQQRCASVAVVGALRLLSPRGVEALTASLLPAVSLHLDSTQPQTRAMGMAVAEAFASAAQPDAPALRFDRPGADADDGAELDADGDQSGDASGGAGPGVGGWYERQYDPHTAARDTLARALARARARSHQHDALLKAGGRALPSTATGSDASGGHAGETQPHGAPRHAAIAGAGWAACASAPLRIGSERTPADRGLLARGSLAVGARRSAAAIPALQRSLAGLLERTDAARADASLAGQRGADRAVGADWRGDPDGDGAAAAARRARAAVAEAAGLAPDADAKSGAETDDSLEPYDLSDERTDLLKVKPPRTLSALLAGLRASTDDGSGGADRVDAALRAAEPLLRAHARTRRAARAAELDSLAGELVPAILHAPNTNGFKGAGEYNALRRRALGALSALCAGRAAPILIGLVYSDSLAVQQRLDCLQALGDAAFELADGKPPHASPAIGAAARQPEWLGERDGGVARAPASLASRDVGEASAGDAREAAAAVIARRLESRTRRFNSGARAAPRARANGFAPHAVNMFMALAARSDQPAGAWGAPGPLARGGDPLVGTALLHLLSSMASLVRREPYSARLARVLFELAAAVRSHADLGVRRAALRALCVAIDALDVADLDSSLGSGRMRELRRWLIAVRTWDDDPPSAALAEALASALGRGTDAFAELLGPGTGLLQLY
jgi:hypothetical protein